MAWKRAEITMRVDHVLMREWKWSDASWDELLDRDRYQKIQITFMRMSRWRVWQA